MWIWLAAAALANDLPDEGFESGSLEGWTASWGDATELEQDQPIEDGASLRIAIGTDDSGFAQAGLYQDVHYADGADLSATVCVAPDPNNPPSGDVYASLSMEVYGADGFTHTSPWDSAPSNLSHVDELFVEAIANPGDTARFVLLVTSETGTGSGGFLFDRVWMGAGAAPGCADLMPEPETGDGPGGGESDDPDVIESECSCSASGGSVGWLGLVPLLLARRRRRVSC